MNEKQSNQVSKFVENMMQRLKQNEHKVSWSSKNCEGHFLIERLEHNFTAYKKIRNLNFDLIMDRKCDYHALMALAEQHLIDVANFAMMLFSQLEEQ